jgi:carbamoyl-phosphate synthase small subunit
MTKAYLIMQDSTIFEGQSVGSEGQVTGKVVPYNGMTGYQQILTDPSCFGDLICMTYPIIGSVGTHWDANSSERIQAGGVILREINAESSSTYTDQEFDVWLTENRCVGIKGVDTRSIMRHLMSQGSMNAVITSVQDPDIQSLVQLARLYIPENYIVKVTTKSPQLYKSEKSGKGLIAAIDLGISRKEKEAILFRGTDMLLFPYNTSPEEIRSYHPNAIYVSNGPKAQQTDHLIIRKTLQGLIGSVPIFAVGNGHLILASAYGLKLSSMKTGHHGVNYPVKDLKTQATYITAQNHSCVVDTSAIQIDSGIKVTHVNINDGSIEGLRYTSDVFSVQFVPDPISQEFNTGYLWDHFIHLIH